MSYGAKSLIVMVIAFTAAIVTAFAVAAILAFGVFGATAPDGLTLMGYIYGISDAEGIACVVAMVVAMIAAMVGTITVGERVIA